MPKEFQRSANIGQELNESTLKILRQEINQNFYISLDEEISQLMMEWLRRKLLLVNHKCEVKVYVVCSLNEECCKNLMLRLKFPLTTNVFNYSKQNSLLSEDCKLYSSLIKKLQNCDAISKTHAMRIFNSLRKDPVGRRILTFRNEEINLLSKFIYETSNTKDTIIKNSVAEIA